MSTALYRRYRPETFADVIGQEHVTAPLMAAIDKDRINHAYLFSGPRGCGKTTSARILARCLNCAQGPTSTPCGVCDSCVELARNGSGSLDVIEIDAASHGGVDDARDLRERATFAPVRDRFKIFIIDEAHMVTSAGFNALLKIVEEPPEHILFIFATTEPDKVIGTIRSRTHHYPFRLVPPEPLMAYLEQLCRQENVPVAPGVLSLVIRAGGGSVRDSLSVLDQLMAGAGENGLDYELAVSLLGYTHATLLDDVVDSMAADDAGTVFDAVDRVIQTGHDPRRFVEDLLERFRDLIVINAVPEGATSILRGIPEDQLNRMRTQANQLGAGELSRAADVTNTALTEMTGATSPRLHLELLCARLLLPAADASVRGTLARVDRIERRLEYAGGAPSAEAAAEPADAPTPPARSRLDVPRNAEEAAARWALPKTEPAPAAESPATSAPDWGGSWGVSTDSAFTESPAPRGAAEGSGPAIPAAQQPEGSGPAVPAARPAESGPAIPAAQQSPAQDERNRADGAGQAPAVDPKHSPTDGPAEAPADSDVDPGRGTWSSAEDPARHEAQHAPGPAAPPARPDVRQPAGEEQPQYPGVPGAQQGPPTGAPAAPRQDIRPSGSAGHADQQGGESQSPQEIRGAEPQRQPASSGGNIEMVRRAWPEIMDEVAKIKRATWLIVNVSAKPRSFEGNQLVLAFVNQGNAIGFQRGPHMDNLKQAIHTVLGLTCSIEAIHDAGGSGESGPKVPASSPARDSTPGHSPSLPSGPSVGRGDQGPAAPVSPSSMPAQPVSGEPASARPSSDRSATDRSPDQRSSEEPVSAATERASAAGQSGQLGQAQGAAPAERSVQSERDAQVGRSAQEGPDGRGPASAAPRTPGAQDPGQTPQQNARRDAVAERGSSPAAPQRVGSASGPARRGDGDRRADTPDVRAETQSSRMPGIPDRPRPTPATTAPAEVGQPSGGQGSPNTSSAAPETVSAWDPSMSDDSWALVEPPEEAFDPGPDWTPAQAQAPQEPGEHRSTDSGPGARHGSTRAPSRPEAAQERNTREPQRTMSPGGARPRPGAAVGPATHGQAAHGQAAHEQADTPAGVEQPTPRPSRSVVWSPDADTAATTPTGPAGPRGIPHFIDPPTSGAPGEVATERAVPGQHGTPVSAPPAASDIRLAAGPGITGPTATGFATTTEVPPSGRPGAATAEPPVPAENGHRKPVSRYQQLLDEAERKRAEEAAAAPGVVDLRFVEDEPSADDETLEDSGLVGRTAIERILNGRLIEERDTNGQ